MDTGRGSWGQCKGPRGTSEGTDGRGCLSGEAANLPCIPSGPVPPLGMGHGHHVTFTTVFRGPSTLGGRSHSQSHFTDGEATCPSSHGYLGRAETRSQVVSLEARHSLICLTWPGEVAVAGDTPSASPSEALRVLGWTHVESHTGTFQFGMSLPLFPPPACWHFEDTAALPLSCPFPVSVPAPGSGGGSRRLRGI